MLAVVWLPAAARADALAPAAAPVAVDLADLAYDQWYLDTVDGQPVGYTHEWMRILDDGTVETGYESRRSETHGGELMVSDSRTVWRESADLEPISIVTESSAGTETVRQTYTFTADGVELVSEQGGRTSSRTLPPVQGDWLSPTALEVVWKRHVEAGDDAFELSTWDPDLGNTVLVLTYAREGAERLELPSGEAVDTTRWKVNYSALPGIDLYELYDDAHVMQAQRVTFSGMEMASLLTDASVAELDFDPPEMAQNSTVKPDRAIARPMRVQRAVFDLTFGDSAPENLLPPTTLHQTAERLANGKVRLHIDMDSENALADRDTAGTDPAYLAASIMIDHTDEEIQKLAAQVRRRAGEDADDYDFGRSARRFVTRYMTGMNLATGDATASEVARSRSGDCTECSVLLAAILRAEGIPSRCVTGLAYAADEFAGVSDVFVYHMWTQAWIADEDGEGGKWVDLDSAMFRYTATHITLGTSAMDDQSAAADMIAMVPMMDGLKIEVVALDDEVDALGGGADDVEGDQKQAAFEPYEAWYVVRMNGEKVGHMHSAMALNDDGHIVTTTDMRMAIARGATEIVVETGSTFVETTDFEPVEATSRMLMATMATQQRMTFGDDGWEITTTQAGRSNTQPIDPFPAGWMTPAHAAALTEQALANGDETVELLTFDLSSGTQLIETVMTLRERGEVEVFGKTVPATRWTAAVSIYPGIELEQWIDDRGMAVRQSVPMGPGMDIEMLLADRELALAEFDAPEVMANTMITPDRKIENPRRLRRAVYEISGPGLDTLDRGQVPTAGFQSVEWVDEDTMRITIDLGFQTPGPGLGEDAERYLAATSALDHEDEAVAALGAEAQGGGGVVTPQRLRDFVRDYIDAKNLSVGFATASEVARTGEGDCTEHGVLLAAMLRGAGIPSRTVTGLVYADQFLGGRDIFGYHMWTQAWIETGQGQGVWVDLDAAFPGQVDGFDATHIALSTSAQSNEDFTNDMVAMLPLMQGLEVKVIELEWAEE